MSLAELLIIFLVALIAFGPKQLPMVARHLARGAKILTHYKEQVAQIWHSHVNEMQLKDNEEKASEADKRYQSIESSDNRSTNE